MDTINQAVAGVKSALGLGETQDATTATNETAGREPISGEQGRGTLTEPYDKGNETSATSNTTTSTTSADTLGNNSATTTNTTSVPSHPNPTSSTTGSTSDTTTSSTNMASSTPSEPGINTSGGMGSDTQASGTSSAATNQPMGTGAPAGQSRPSAGERPGDVRPTEANENRPNTNAGGFGTAEPSVNADPKSAQQPKTAQQGSDRPLNEPDSEETQAIKDDKKEAEGEQKGSSSGPGHHISDEEREELAAKGKLPKDPNDHSGEPMHMHGGSEDPKKEEKEEVSEGGVTDKQRKDSIGQEGGAPHGSSKGTGEEYVKSTGLAADGGDFDASRPGAGKEAARLMEEKGMHRDSDGPSSSGGKAVGDDHKDESKPSAFQKLKEKMNPGTGSGLD